MAAHAPDSIDRGLGLTLAVIASSHEPALLLDDALTVIGASASFSCAFGLPPAEVAGRPIFDLGEGEWNVPQLKSLLNAMVFGAEIDAYEMDLARPGAKSRRLVLNARKLDYGEGENVRLLVSVADVTDARAGEKLHDDLLREKAILLQELQHRVANSLQIIASVLLQSARKVQSEETRGHLHDAHNRVMSIAAVQKQLDAHTLGPVALKPYLDGLCQSLAASMIHDSKQLKIVVTVDDTAVSADVSVSLGLIVTELVINALKHAFPDHRSGWITVEFETHGAGWTLSVGDNGIGMPNTPAKPGLGTSIVEALARQLDARIKVLDSKPGTQICVSHSKLALVDTGRNSGPATEAI